MSIFKMDSYEMNVVDFLATEGSVIMDIKFEDEQEMKKFLEFYKSHGCDSGAHEVYIETNKYYGWCGPLTYDEKFNARLYIEFAEQFSGMTKYFKVFESNIIKALNTSKTAMEELLSLLESGSPIDAKAKHKIMSHFPKNGYGEELYMLVDDLSTYLKGDKITLEELRQLDI